MKQRSFIVPLLLLSVMAWFFLFPCVGKADIQLVFESPANNQTVSGVSTVSGWAFSEDTAEPVTVRLRIGEDESVVPCCGSRADVSAVHSGFPQAATSGFGQVFNFNLLEPGEHTFTIEVEDATGAVTEASHTITTVKPGNFEFLERLDIRFAGIRIGGNDDIVIEGAGAIDSVTGNAQEVDVRLAWQENLQALGVVSSKNTGSVTEAQTSRMAGKNRRAESVRNKDQVEQKATVQLPAVIRIDPNTGNRTVVSDADTVISEDGTDFPAGPNWAGPQGVTVEADGRLAVTDPGRVSVYRVDPATGERTFVSGTSALSGPPFIRPTGIAVAPPNSEFDGVLVVADTGQGVIEISSTGKRFLLSDFEIEDAVQLESPFGIAAEPDGSVVVADLGLKALVRVTLDTEDRVIFSDSDNGTGENWIRPLDIDVEESGNLLVVDGGLNAVVRVDPTNGNRTIVSKNATNGAGPPFSQVRALAIEANGQLVVLDEGARAIFRVDPTSGNRIVISDASTGSGDEFRAPTDIAVEADGNLIVVETLPLLAAFENPSGDSAGGFGIISGWRFSNTAAATITDLQLKIDGESSFDLLCCLSRADVGNRYIERPQAVLSGFSAPINFNLLESGRHTFDVTIEDSTGLSRTLTSELDTVRLGNFEFIESFDLSNAEVRLGNQTFFVDDILVQGKGITGELESREIDTSFVWQPSCQCFVVSSECGNGSLESSEECDGTDFVGDLTCQKAGFSGGELSCRREDCSLDFTSCEGGPAVLVTNSGDSTVSLLSAATNLTLKTIPVGKDPRSVAVKPDSRVAYITNAQDDSITVMSLDTLVPELTVVTNTIENVGSIPVGLAFTPNGAKAYVVNGGENTVRVIDTATETVDTTVIPVGREPLEIAIDAAGTRAYVTNFSDNTVSVIDLGTNTVIETIGVGRGPNGLAIRPDGAEIYVVNLEEDTVSIIEAGTNTVRKTLTREVDEGNIGLRPQKVVFSPDGTRAYISNSLDFTVTVIDTATSDSINLIFVGVESFNDVINEPNGLFISPNGHRLYVSLFGRNGQGDFIGVFSTGTNRIQAFTEVGKGPIGVTVGGS